MKVKSSSRLPMAGIMTSSGFLNWLPRLDLSIWKWVKVCFWLIKLGTLGTQAMTSWMIQWTLKFSKTADQMSSTAYLRGISLFLTSPLIKSSSILKKGLQSSRIRWSSACFKTWTGKFIVKPKSTRSNTEKIWSGATSLYRCKLLTIWSRTRWWTSFRGCTISQKRTSFPKICKGWRTCFL